jgi:hypothetical protein
MHPGALGPSAWAAAPTRQSSASPAPVRLHLAHLLVPMLFSSEENRAWTSLPGAAAATTSREA